MGELTVVLDESRNLERSELRLAVPHDRFRQDIIHRSPGLKDDTHLDFLATERVLDADRSCLQDAWRGSDYRVLGDL